MEISEYLFGYRRIYTEDSERRALANLLVTHGISAVEEEDGSFRLSLLSYRKLCKLGNCDVVYSATPPLGLYGAIRGLLPMWGMHLGILLSVMILLFLRAHVLEVRIEGNETVSDVSILRELESVGLFGGARWKDIDLSAVESRMLESSQTVGWLSINRRALVAYVTVKEREHIPPQENTSTAQNLVSRADAVVEEVLLERGTALVRVGDSVAKGALLISGITEDGTLVHAKGEVLGRVRTEVETVSERVRDAVVARERHRIGLSLHFFGKTINILKTPSNLPSDCVIIENNSKVTLFFGRTLPISVTSAYLIEEHTVPYRMTDDELMQAARTQHREALSHYLAEGELLSLSTHIYPTEQGCRTVSTVSVLIDLCRSVPIATDE